MTKFGSPFQSGTLSSVIMGIAIGLAFLYWFSFDSPERRPIALLMIFFAVAASVRAFFRYRKLTDQGGQELLDED